MNAIQVSFFCDVWSVFMKNRDSGLRSWVEAGWKGSRELSEKLWLSGKRKNHHTALFLLEHDRSQAVVAGRLDELVPRVSFWPDLSANDRFTFPNLKEWLDGGRFASNEEVKTLTLLSLGNRFYSEKCGKATEIKMGVRWKLKIILLVNLCFLRPTPLLSTLLSGPDIFHNCQWRWFQHRNTPIEHPFLLTCTQGDPIKKFKSEHLLSA